MFKHCPDFFTTFQDRVLELSPEHEAVKRLGLKVRSNPSGRLYVEGLSSAASKWRLASDVSGLSVNSYSRRVAEAYSSFLLIKLTSVAVEAYARVFHKDKWNLLEHRCFAERSKEIGELVRPKIPVRFLSLLEEVSHDGRLKGRVKAFATGEDLQIISVVHATRNVFAHGKLGGDVALRGIGPTLRDLMLSAIKADIESITEQIKFGAT